MEKHEDRPMSAETTRRRFLKHSGMIGAGVMLAGPLNLLGVNNLTAAETGNITSRGYAARDSSGILSPWEFERRPLGDNDVLIDIKFCGVCHSDIHAMRGDWGPEQYPQVPGHEIAGIVAAVGKNVTRFKPGDRAGVGCMVSSCMDCPNCKNGLEHYCRKQQMKVTYGAPDTSLPTGITQGGYSKNIVVTEHFVIKIPDNIKLEHAAPLLCAGITTYSPLMRAKIKEGDRVGVAGIGGLGHMAVKLAISKGAEVYAFTTTEDKVDDIRAFGAKEAVYVESPNSLWSHFGSLDYMVATIPVDFDLEMYASLVKPFGEFTLVGMPKGGMVSFNNAYMVRNLVNINGSMIGGIPQTQEVIDYCAKNGIHPQIEMIPAKDVNKAWEAVVNKEARYRYVIDIATM